MQRIGPEVAWTHREGRLFSCNGKAMNLHAEPAGSGTRTDNSNPLFPPHPPALAEKIAELAIFSTVRTQCRSKLPAHIMDPNVAEDRLLISTARLSILRAADIRMRVRRYAPSTPGCAPPEDLGSTLFQRDSACANIPRMTAGANSNA